MDGLVKEIEHKPTSTRQQLRTAIPSPFDILHILSDHSLGPQATPNQAEASCYCYPVKIWTRSKHRVRAKFIDV